jgi:tetratricopeptide (TPR) repeat protein
MVPKTLCSMLVFSVAAGLVCPGPTYAQSPPKLSASEKRELTSLMEAGQAAYERGEFERSLRYFQDAYELYAHPNLLYRIALSHEKLGHDKDAISFYRSFLEERPDTKKRGRIEQTIKVLEKRLADKQSVLRIKSNPAVATVYINETVNGASGTTPLEVPISPGTYKVIVKKEGYKTVEETVEVAEGETLSLSYSLAKEAKLEDDDAYYYFPTGPLLLAGASVLSGVGAWLSYDEYSEASDQLEYYNALKAEGQPRPADYNATHENKQFYGAMTWVGGALAIGGLTAATLWYLNDDAYSQAPVEDDDTAFAVTPGIGPNGSSVQVIWEF